MSSHGYAGEADRLPDGSCPAWCSCHRMRAEVELPDDADAKRAMLAELVAYRRQVLQEAAARLDAFDRGEAATIVRAMADG